MARSLSFSQAQGDDRARFAVDDDPPCWHTEPGTPCDYDVCLQPERLARGDQGQGPTDPADLPLLSCLRANGQIRGTE